MVKAIQIELQTLATDISRSTVSDSEAQFKKVFTSSFNKLKHYAFTIVRDDVTAEEMVQNVFCRLWERNLGPESDLLSQPYLYKAVYNECLNHLKQEKHRAKHKARVANEKEQTAEPVDRLDSRVLEKEVHQAINALPEQCRTVFQLSRMEQLKNREIAETLGISVKTVETQMTKALKTLRQKLAHFLPTLILYLF